MNKATEIPLAVGSLGLAAIGALTGCTPRKAEPSKPMNIVYIMCDDHSFQTISAYDHPLSRLAPTPNIDRLAAQGIRFDRAYVENSLSTPSRACLMDNTMVVYTSDQGFYMGEHGWFDKRYKLIHFYDETGAIPSYDEFFDLQEDPNELNNLIDNPKYGKLVGKFRKQLSQTRETIGVTEF